jgi:hypothetical protein
MSVLTQMGAETVTMEQLCDFETLPCSVISLFEQ